MFLALPFVILSALLAVNANIAHGAHVGRHHARIPVARAPLETPPALKKRQSCKARSASSSAKATTTSHTSTTTKKTSTKATTTTKKTTAAAAKPTPQIAAAVSGLINVNVARCGSNGATKSITATTGPNGSLDWLNCGVASGGWNPPYISVDNMIAADLSQAIKSPSTPFSACSAYVGMFEKYADQYGLPAIMLASFAMQESSCNPATVGGAGEQGLMQLTKDKCGGAPGGNCKDPDFNIRTGAKYFADTLAGNNGNILLSIGEYNGWFEGLTVAKATAAKNTGCCRCQKQPRLFMNGWIQNVNAYSNNLGKYHNLDACPSD